MQDPTDVPRGIRDLRVDPALCPGSVSGTERLPSPGERVYTHEGTAVVVRLLGRTGSAGRLLELSMDDGRKGSFFASAANVRVASLGGAPIPPTVKDPP
jgi:hypothetical protein